jgi:hypothetical protein
VTALADLLPTKVREYGKAVAAIVYAFTMALAMAGPNITWMEWVGSAMIGLGAGGFVAGTPNRLTLDQVERFYRQIERESASSLDDIE